MKLVADLEATKKLAEKKTVSYRLCDAENKALLTALDAECDVPAEAVAAAVQNLEERLAALKEKQ